MPGPNIGLTTCQLYVLDNLLWTYSLTKDADPNNNERVTAVIREFIELRMRDSFNRGRADALADSLPDSM